MSSGTKQEAGLHLGLAGAEQRLFTLQLDSGQIANVRNILRLRIDYLSQLNTPAMLIASADVGLLSTLSYSYLEPDNVADQSFFRMACVVLYTAGCSVSLAASLWVLYTCNNLVNLATMATLAAKDLKGVQGADLVLELRMADVRGWYMLSLATMVAGLFAMVLAMMEVYVAIPSIIGFFLVVVHAIHADHETSFYFEKVSGVKLDTRREYVVDDLLVSGYRNLEKFISCIAMRRKSGFKTLGGRIERLFERRYDRAYIQRVKEESARRKQRRLRDRIWDAKSAPLLKTSSQNGPIAVLNSVAFERDPEVRRQLLQYTAANTPTHVCWWVLQGNVLSCYKQEKDWRDGTKPGHIIDLEHYTVVEAFDHDRRLTIALIPKAVFRHDTPFDSSHHIDPEIAGRSWYLSGGEQSETVAWLEMLREACGESTDLDGDLFDCGASVLSGDGDAPSRTYTPM